MSTDPTTILREAIATAILGSLNGRPTELDLYLREANAVLATRIPQACQTCKGSGVECVKAYSDGVPMIERPCPDCPTIGTLLRYGWNVATAMRYGKSVNMRAGAFSTTEASALLAVLREVPT